MQNFSHNEINHKLRQDFVVQLMVQNEIDKPTNLHLQINLHF